MDPSKAKYQTEAALEEAKKKAAGIGLRKWYNSKVHAHNYIDGMTISRKRNSYSHGMHVTGITKGNPNKEAPNNEYVYGVAPEAQVTCLCGSSQTVSVQQATLSTSRLLMMQ